MKTMKKTIKTQALYDKAVQLLVNAEEMMLDGDKERDKEYRHQAQVLLSVLDEFAGADYCELIEKANKEARDGYIYIDLHRNEPKEDYTPCYSAFMIVDKDCRILGSENAIDIFNNHVKYGVYINNNSEIKTVACYC